MGEYSIFECRACGYRSERIRWGVGSDDPCLRFLPAHCQECAVFTEVELTGHDILTEKFTCDRCGSEVAFTEHVDHYECPAARAATSPFIRTDTGSKPFPFGRVCHPRRGRSNRHAAVPRSRVRTRMPIGSLALRGCLAGPRRNCRQARRY